MPKNLLNFYGTPTVFQTLCSEHCEQNRSCSYSPVYVRLARGTRLLILLPIVKTIFHFLTKLCSIKGLLIWILGLAREVSINRKV